ncbi:MAG: sulfatase-like hydrolase/transferase [bacterium]|jgi:arylsulfatase A-like enzyme
MMKRRSFIQTLMAGTAATGFSSLAHSGDDSSLQEQPNILWITSEDNGPQLGAYGDSYADTPNLDALAKRGMIYTNAWSTAPVCAPARTTIIAGVYPTCTGGEHMRSSVHLPGFMKMFPQYLREAGYYCTNNSKEDYNYEKPGRVWDESSNKAHWRNRNEGQPFFAVFNFTTTHESQIRKRPHEARHDPAKVPLPAYHPDTRETRQDWAQYYDKITEMDAQAGEIMKQLEEDGLAENTIIFYYGDHGAGMPRSKRWTYHSGLHVPLIVFFPEKFRHLAPDHYQPGGQSDRLVGFVDLAPTVLSLAGIQPPQHMQGHAFLGKYITPEPEFAFGFRGRMDERYDLVRTVRNKRYQYIRNYMPHKIYGQYVSYMFETPTTQIWRDLYDKGELTPPKTFFWETKPPEELYDLENDPGEVRNLADSPDHRKILTQLRRAHDEHVMNIRDIGFLPEDEIHSRAEDTTSYEMGHDPAAYPLERILKTAQIAARYNDEDLPQLTRAYADNDSAIRYWAMMGILIRGSDAVKSTKETLYKALTDKAPSPAIIAAQALGEYGTSADAQKAMSVLMEYANPEKHSAYTAMLALNAIDAMNRKAKTPYREQIANLPDTDSKAPARANSYVSRLKEKIDGDLST